MLEQEQIKESKTVEQLEEEAKERKILLECYENIKQTLEKYMDMEQRNYSIIAIWILGTYFHRQFPTYPYLFLNAMKGSGKTRLLKLIAKFSKNGEILNSLTEAVLFREQGTLCVDEFEGITRPGKESLRELLNSAYKDGTKIKRYRKASGKDGEKQVKEEFEVYRPIAMANIWGMEDVLGDRCIQIILEKSNNQIKSKLMEVFDYDYLITTTLTTLTTLTTQKITDWCSLCSVVAVRNIYMMWNNYINNTSIYTTTLTTHTTITTLTTLFNKIKETDINGRNLELAFPFFFIAFQLDLIKKENFLGGSVFEEIIESFNFIFNEKRIEEFTENRDILIIDFLSQELEENYFVSISNLFQKFKQFSQITENEYMNTRWFGRRLKTLNLIKEKRRVSKGIEIIPNYNHAKEKIKMFNVEVQKIQ